MKLIFVKFVVVKTKIMFVGYTKKNILYVKKIRLPLNVIRERK